MRLFDGFNVIFNCPKTIKIIATMNNAGCINAEFRNHLYMDLLGKIYLFEVPEYSIVNCNLVNALWFSKKAVISILSESQQSFELQVDVVKAIVSGKEFRSACEWLGEEYERFDLSSVWVLEPVEVRETTYSLQLQNERIRKPLISHLDRIARREDIHE